MSIKICGPIQSFWLTNFNLVMVQERALRQSNVLVPEHHIIRQVGDNIP